MEKEVKVKNRLFQNIVYLFFGNVVTRGLSMVAVLLFARSVTKDDNGILGLALSFSGILTFFTEAGLSNTTIREATKRDADISSTMYSYAKVRAILFIVVSIGSIIIASLMYANDPILRNSIIAMTVPSLLGSFLQGIGTVYFQIVEKMKYVSFITVIFSIGNAAALFLGIFLHLSVFYVCLFYGISSIFTGVLSVWLASRELTFKKEFNKMVLNHLLAFTINGGATLLITQLAPIILEKILGTELVGDYNAATKFSSVLYLFPGIIATAFYPRLFMLGNEKQYKEHRSLSGIELKVMAICGAILTIPFVVDGEFWMLTLLTEKYLSATPVLIISSYLIFFQAVKYPLADYLTTIGQQTKRTVIMVVGLVVAVVLYFVLSINFGIIGGALAPVITEFVLILGFTLCIPKGVRFFMNHLSMIILSFCLTLLLYKTVLVIFHPLIAITIAETVFLICIAMTDKDVRANAILYTNKFLKKN